MKKIVLAILAAFGLIAGPASAQSTDARDVAEALAGTLSVVSTPMISGGRVTACTLVFEHFQRDDLYLLGNFIKVSGSIGIMEAEGQVGFMMKAIANEFDPTAIGSRSIDLERVYLLTPTFYSNFDSLLASYPTDVPGGILSAYTLDPGGIMFMEGLSAGTVTVAVGPKSGASDIQLKLDLSVVATDAQGQRTRSETPVLEFFSCADRLLSGIVE